MLKAPKLALVDTIFEFDKTLVPYWRAPIFRLACFDPYYLFGQFSRAILVLLSTTHKSRLFYVTEILKIHFSLSFKTEILFVLIHKLVLMLLIFPCFLLSCKSFFFVTTKFKYNELTVTKQLFLSHMELGGKNNVCSNPNFPSQIC